VQKIKLEKFQNGDQDGSQNGSSKVLLAIMELFINQFT